MVYLGQSVRRFEDPRLVTGQGAYVDDIELPHMLHVAILRSPHAHARIRSLDVTAARSLPGVAAVFTSVELEGVLQSVPTGISAYEGKFDHMEAPEHPVLAKEKVCYVGQPVVMVLADDLSVAWGGIDSG